MAASSAVALRCCNSNFRPWRAAHAAQLRPEADADLAALDPRRLGLLRWADGGLTVIGKDLTKSQRRRLSELAALAHQRELDAELGKLETEFRRWRSGELSPHELSDLIHAFHDGPSRELFSRYDRRLRDFAVVDAVRRGVLSEAEVGSEILSLLASQLSVTD